MANLNNFKILKLYLIFIGLLINSIDSLQGQNIVKGVLRDAKSGEPLIGATVIIKGSSEGTISDYEGAFVLKTSLTLPLILEFRYSGYASIEFQYAEANKSVNVNM